jgi:hypothetical protein
LPPGQNATVTNVGSSSAATFNFGIPQGIQGNTGATGATGPTGPAGATGPQGPTAVSTNANNYSTLGTDSLLFTPTPVIPAGSSTVPVMDGTAAVGTGTTWARADHKHPTDTSRLPATAISTDSGNIAQLGSDSLILVPQSVLWNQRLRSFSSIGNGNFEVAQRNCGATIATPASGSFIEDRWAANNATGLAFSLVRATPSVPSIGFIPGTNYCIANAMMRFIVNTPKATLAAGDTTGIYQFIEGPLLRELIGDVHSVSLLVRSSISPVHFCLWIRTAATPFYSLCKLCTYNVAANSTQIIQLPNLPNFSASGTWPLTPGNAGYMLGITLASGSTYIPPANDSWQSGNYMGAVGMDNFMANVANSSFDVFMVQHEPGPVTQFMDLPFSGPNGNLEACQRCYQKSYLYTTKPGTIGNPGMLCFIPAGAVNPAMPIAFKKTMAKVPTITGYSQVTGTANTIRDGTNAADRAVTGAYGVTDNGFNGFAVTGGVSTVWQAQFDYTADTGW